MFIDTAAFRPRHIAGRLLRSFATIVAALVAVLFLITATDQLMLTIGVVPAVDPSPPNAWARLALTYRFVLDAAGRTIVGAVETVGPAT